MPQAQHKATSPTRETLQAIKNDNSKKHLTMLTEEALQERLWGKYPSLRKHLQKKKIPNYYYGFSSVSDNIFNRISRLLEVTILVKEFLNIKEKMSNSNREGIVNDLERLLYELEDLRQFITQEIGKFNDMKFEIQNES